MKGWNGFRFFAVDNICRVLGLEFFFWRLAFIGLIGSMTLKIVLRVRLIVNTG